MWLSLALWLLALWVVPLPGLAGSANTTRTTVAGLPQQAAIEAAAARASPATGRAGHGEDAVAKTGAAAAAWGHLPAMAGKAGVDEKTPAAAVTLPRSFSRSPMRPTRPSAPLWAWLAAAAMGALALRHFRRPRQTRPTAPGPTVKPLAQILGFSVTLLLGVAMVVAGTTAETGGYLANSWVFAFLTPVGAVLILVGVVIGIAFTVDAIKKHKEKKKREEAERRRQLQQQREDATPRSPGEAPANPAPTPLPTPRRATPAEQVPAQPQRELPSRAQPTPGRPAPTSPPTERAPADRPPGP